MTTRFDGDGYFHRPLQSMEKMMEMDDELKELKREQEHFESVVEDAKRHFGQWDMCDPVVGAILRVVQAQNGFAHAIDQGSYRENERVVEAAIKKRRKAIAALQEALKDEPRGFQ
jgi:hypothetical protein